MNTTVRCACVLAAGVFAATASNTVYVAASYGLYRSTDAGSSWEYINVPLNNPLLSGSIVVQSLGRDPHDGSKIYFIGHATAWAFFASPDEGKTWTATPFVGMTPSKIAVDAGGQTIYLIAFSSGSGSGFLYTSTDTGATWKRQTVRVASTDATAFPNGLPVQQLISDPQIAGTLYVVTDGPKFFKTTDFGASWAQVSLGPGIYGAQGAFAQTSLIGMHLDPWNPGTWYATADHSLAQQACPASNGSLCGLFKSTNGGSVFSALSIPSNYVTDVSFGAASGTVYATGDVSGLGGAVLRSTDGGDTWTPLKAGLFSPHDGRIWADTTDGSTVYVNDFISQHDFYSATDAGCAANTRCGPVTFNKIAFPQGPFGCGTHTACIQQTIYDVMIVPSTKPVITSVVNGASLQPGISSYSWVTVFGTNLSPGVDNWSNFIVNGRLPTAVDSVSVSVDGQPAYVYYISPGQLNILAPNITSRTPSVTVTTSNGTSDPYAATADQYAPAFFAWPNNQVVATRQNFTFAAKAGTFAGANTTPAAPGDVLILWATGLGPTQPSAPAGVAVPGDQGYTTPSLPVVTIGGHAALVYGAALAPGSAGLYQIAIQVPTLGSGDWSIQMSIGGVQSTGNLVLSVQNASGGGSK